MCIMLIVVAEITGSIFDASLLSLGERNSTGKTQAAILTDNAGDHKTIVHFQLENSILENSNNIFTFLPPVTLRYCRV